MALGFPREFCAEMFFPSQGWVDVSTSVRQTDPVTVNPGKANEQGKVPSTKCTLTLADPDGDFAMHNPHGDYFGELGRNTPFQWGFLLAEDTFTRTVADSWGTANTGEVWTHVSNPANYDVGGSTATVVIATASTSRTAYLEDLAPFGPYEVTATVTVPSGTGGTNTFGPVVRGASESSFAQARIQVTNAGAASLRVTDASGATVFGTFDLGASAGTYTVRVLVEDDTIRAKAWEPADPVPYDWQVSATADEGDINPTGWAGMNATTGTGSTNATFTLDNYTVRIIRFSGQVADLQPGWDETHQIRTTELEASGLMRSLIQGKPFEVSSLRRAITDEADQADPDTPAYWPCEDGKNSQVIAAVRGYPMVFSGSPKFAQFDDFACSQPILILNGATLTGTVPTYDNSATVRSQVRFLLSVPADGDAPVDSPLVELHCTGGRITTLGIEYDPASGGQLRLRITDPFGSTVSGYTTTFPINGSPMRFGVDLTQDGADLDVALTYARIPPAIGLDATYVTAAVTTLTNQSFGRVAQVVWNRTGGFIDTAIGHAAVQGDVTPNEDLSDQLAAWAGESTVDRFGRLAEQNAIPARVIGSAAQAALMGVQLPGPVLDLMQSCADAELATLFEDRSHLGLVLRTLARTQGQDPRLTLDYAAKQVAPPLQPKADDQIRNDVLAKRLRGSEYRATQTTGPNNINPPSQDAQGVGRYEHQFTAVLFDDGQLQNTAGVVKGRGTVDEERYPRVTVNLRANGVDAATTAALLGVSVDDRIVLQDLTDAKVYHPIDQIARGYTETLTDSAQHKITFNTTPYSPYRVGRWDDEQTRWDSSTSTLATGIDDNDLSLSVAVTGTLWTTDGAFFPMTVAVGPPGGRPGEVLTLSAISGASSPQTFTVSARAVNGVSRGWDAGSEVHVYPRTRWGR